MAIDLNRLKKVPHKVVLAAGRNKAASLIAACKGGYVNAIITDEIAAMTMEHMLNGSEPSL